jgi:hypothetical protein
MKEFAIPPKHLMLALLLSLLAGCGGGSDPVVPKALTEHDFAADRSLRLEAGSVGVTFLEPKDAVPASTSDTGLPGTDEFPLRIAEQTTSTYAIDPADNTIAMVKLIRLPGNEGVFVLNAAQPGATVTLEPGEYKLVLYSGYTVAEASGETHRAVFLHDSTPTPALVQAAMNASVPRKSILANASQYVYLFTNNYCQHCDLTGASLFRANLSGADLGYSNLTGADLRQANLSGTMLAWADLTRANLEGANLAGAYLSGAIWTDGRICAWRSTGTCN